MKHTVLSRYERIDDGSIAIDVAATRVEDLYNDFDKSAPYIRRDLSKDLGDYLIDCAKELKNELFVMRFTLVQPPDDVEQSRIRQSISAYFLYLVEGERQKVIQKFRRSAILFCIGLAILFFSVSINQSLSEEQSIVANVFAEGLTVAAWVSLWESFAVFMIGWYPNFKNIVLYRRLAHARLIFMSVPQEIDNSLQ